MYDASSHRLDDIRVLACVTFHFDSSRLKYLAEILRALSEFSAAALHVSIVTNVGDKERVQVLQRLCFAALPGATAEVSSHTNLGHPHDLAWCHKAIIANDFVDNNNGRFTHFIYLEDDIRLTNANFVYFLEGREILRDVGLLPAFVRTEYSTAKSTFVASDAFWPVYVPVQSHLEIAGAQWINLPNPYNPCFILDADLAVEYVQSRSFHQNGSLSVCGWGIRERAAMGLCLENVPPMFQSRYVVPVKVPAGYVPAGCLISHLPNNYAEDPRSPLGKVRLDELFAGSEEILKPNGHMWVARQLPRWASELAQTTSNPVASSDVTRVHRYFLVSDHDTVVFCDVAGHFLRHSPLGIAPLNLIVEVRANCGRLLRKTALPGKERHLALTSTNGSIAERENDAAFDLEIEHFDDGRIGLKAGNNYIAADYDGKVRNNRIWCRDWERYRVLREDTLYGLATLRRYVWIDHSDGHIATLSDQPITFGHEPPSESSALAATITPQAMASRRELAIGAARFRLAGPERSIIVHRPQREGEPPNVIEIVDRRGRTLQFSRFAPLALYSAYGGDSDYNKLQKSLTSLEQIGLFAGAIGLFCDRPQDEVLKYVPASLHDQLIACFDRMRSAHSIDWNHKLIIQHRPILLCSLDTMFTSRILDTLVEAILECKIFVDAR